MLWACVVVAIVASHGCGGSNSDNLGPLTEAQILGTAVASNDHDIQVATAARPLVVAQQARDFADRMIREHGDANGRLQALAQTLHMDIDPSSVDAGKFPEDTPGDIELLTQNRTGIQIDFEYVKEAVHDSGKAVKEYDRQLLRQAMNPSLLEELRVQRQTSVDDIAVGKAVLPTFGSLSSVGD
jgi:putative membrane protein